MFENDDIDLYQEENNPTNSNQYKTPEGFDTYAVAQRTIKVKDTSDVTLTVKTSRHGPIMNDLIDGLGEKTSSDVMDLYPTTVAYFRCGIPTFSR
jgi:penicillin amidase